jgi:hypothetical protein
MEKLHYLPPMYYQHHFVGFTRVDPPKNVTDGEWSNLAKKVENTVFKLMRQKIKELSPEGMCRHCGEIRDVMYSSDMGDIGFLLQSVPDSLWDKSDSHVSTIKKLNKFAFEEISKLATDGQVDVCFKLMQVCVLDASSYYTLKSGLNRFEENFMNSIALKKV